MGHDSSSVTPSQPLGSLKSYSSTTAVSISQIIKLTTEERGLIIHEHKVCNINLVALIIQILVQTPNRLVALVDDYTSEPLEINFWRADERSPDWFHRSGKTIAAARRLFGTKVSYRSSSSASTTTSTTDGSILIADNNDEVNLNKNDATSSSGFSDEYELHKDLMDFKVHDYIRILGRIKCIGSSCGNECTKLKILAFDVKLINDPNLITMHLLEVIRDSMFYQQRVRDREAQAEARMKLPRYMRELKGKELEMFSFVLEEARKSAQGSVAYRSIRRHFKLWSLQEIATTISNIERAGLMWQGEAEDLWQPDIMDR